MDINLGSTDRMIRLILGTALVYAAFVASNAWGALLMVVAVSALLNGVTGKCLIYRLLGISTARSRLQRGRSVSRSVVLPAETLNPSALTPDGLADAVKQLIEDGRTDRLTIRQGDWTLIDLPLTVTRAGALEAPLLEFIRARAEVSGYSKLTVRH
ncbi:MAG TPA: YgaP-like transmembrane domain [bacterium]|jgi:hypothetical protein|nr:YgaP-like transmembrane domain [bacterium]